LQVINPWLHHGITCWAGPKGTVKPHLPYTITPTHIPDLLILEPKVFGDSRGFFFESFNQQDFNQVTGLSMNFVQDNHSRSSVRIENLIQLNQRLMV
jgi:hypothetical protein